MGQQVNQKNTFPVPKSLAMIFPTEHVCLGPPLWSSSQSSWLQIQRSRFSSWHYQIFLEVVGLERGTLSLVSTTEELLGSNSSGSGLEICE
jgi:hypothetical protein